MVSNAINECSNFLEVSASFSLILLIPVDEEVCCPQTNVNFINLESSKHFALAHKQCHAVLFSMSGSTFYTS